MNFKKLEVSGFKSFADRLEVAFSQGITAIVGPNGCGKSNVADSIRWVLGEQSAKLLRGSSMQDVIFNGTEKRKSLSYAEVALHFDNKDRIFPLDYNEVVISRKLYRSGESEYFLNKNLCRLKDIISILRDCGMGREGYSIIGQGRIESLLSAKPEDRRAIFEEAAGISKHKAQKRESENKLERTEVNITRLLDIKAEKASYLEPLSKQAEKTRQYLTFKDELRLVDINIFLHGHDSADKAKAVISSRLNRVVEELEASTVEYDSANVEFDDIFAQINSNDSSQRAVNDNLRAASVELEKQSSDIRVIETQLESVRETTVRLDSDRDRLELDRLDNIKLLEQTRLQEMSLADSIESVGSRLDKLLIEYKALDNIIESGAKEREDGSQSLLEAYDRLADIKSNMSRLIAERDGLTIKLGELVERERELVLSIEADIATLEAQRAVRDDLDISRDRLLDELNDCESKSKEYIVRLSRLSTESDELSKQYHIVRAQLKLASDMRDANEGFGHTVKKLMRDQKSDERIARLIKGVVGQAIRVDQKYELAIETALGAAIQNIIVDNENDAKELIAYLRDKKYGRATFLPLTSVKRRTVDGQYRALLAGSGICGIASELVAYDDYVARAINSLLGATIIVDSLDTGITLAKQMSYACKIVSLQGDVLSTMGAITGGDKRDRSMSIFGYDRDCATLETEIESLNNKITTIMQGKDELESARNVVLARIDALSSEIATADITLAQNYQRIVTLEETIIADRGTLAECKDSIISVQGKIEVIELDIGSVGELEQLMHMDKASARETMRDKQVQLDTMNDSRRNMQQSIAGLEINKTKFESERVACISRIDSIVQYLDRLTDDIASVGSKLESSKSRELVLASDITDALSNISSGRDVERYKVELEVLEQGKAELVDRQAKLDKIRIDISERIRRLSDSKTKEEIQLAKVDSDIVQIGERIAEEYGLAYDDCLPFRENKSISSLTVTQKQLRRAISDLGSINLAAIDESKELFASYDELCVQIDDLEKAKADLRRVIKSLNKEMNDKFEIEFAKIRASFVVIFRELFNGGNADLVLDVNEDMSEDERLEAGIEIVAQPPEKKLQSISLLSGGERALTAIAILFAILRQRPMPFCVLDEIEAALDDANAHRFAQYLHRFSKETQFIVITHRKPTMEMSDSLYGVTMEEKGVSKIVSVRLSDAVRVAEPMAVSV